MAQRKRVTILAALSVLFAACSGSDPSPAPAPAQSLSAQAGGEATVLLDSAFAGSWPAGLDPATNPNGGANISLMNSIYGGLFQLVSDEDGSNARIEGDLAAGYEIADEGRSFVIHLREGVTFSDGTPFDASAVRFSIERARTSKCSCAPTNWPFAAEQPVSTPDERTVVLHFSRPYGPVAVAVMASNMNWVVSPTALNAAGEEAFRLKPVGAGPFEVVSGVPSNELVLKRNPRYWRKGRPYLDRLVFRSVGGDQAAYQALLARDAHAYEGMSSPLLIQEAERSGSLTVTRQLATSQGFVQLNTRVAPFNDRRAREAIYYATDVAALRKGLFNDLAPSTQSFTTAAGLFHRPTVAGYRTYNLEQARAIVKELGGLKVTLGTLQSLVARQIVTALKSQWQAAGMDVQIEFYEVGGLIGKYTSGEWQSMMQYLGSYDPDVGSGLRFRFGSTSPFSGTKDPALDDMLKSAVASVDAGTRRDRYFEIGQYLSDNAYAPFLVAQSAAHVTRGLHGPGLTTRIPPVMVTTSILWHEVWTEQR